MQDTADEGMVILVDDDAAVRNSLKFALELEGYSVQTYSSPEQALQEGHFPKRRCCLVLDYKLPHMDGLQLLKHLRARGVMLPAILLTSNPSTALNQQAFEAGIQLVEKPLLGDCLIQGIHGALAEARI